MEDVETAANDFRDSMVARCDGKLDGAFPWWHGWVIRAAFVAGAEFEKANQRMEK